MEKLCDCDVTVVLCAFFRREFRFSARNGTGNGIAIKWQNLYQVCTKNWSSIIKNNVDDEYKILMKFVQTLCLFKRTFAWMYEYNCTKLFNIFGYLIYKLLKGCLISIYIYICIYDSTHTRHVCQVANLMAIKIGNIFHFTLSESEARRAIIYLSRYIRTKCGLKFTIYRLDRSRHRWHDNIAQLPI